MKRGRWALVAAGAVVCFFWVGQGAEPVRDYFEEGRAAYSRGDYPLAVDRLSEALARSPGDKRAQRLLVAAGQKITGKQALEQISLDDLRLMVSEANKVLDQRQKEIRRVLDELKIAQRESGKFTAEETVRACRGVDLLLDVTLGDDQESRQFRDYLHSVCANLKSALDRGILLRPEDEQRVFGYVAFCRSDWAVAAQTWEQALKINPSDTHLHELLAVAKANLAQQQIETKTVALLSKAETALSAHHDDEALDLLRKGINEFPGEERLMALYEKTQERVSKQAQERGVATHRERALAAQKKGQWLAAAQSWLAVLNADPLNAEAKENLDLLKHRLDPVVGPPAPTSPEDLKRSEELYTLGLIRYAEGDLEKSFVQFKKCLKINPHHEYARKALERVEEERKPLP